jgi:hypothetical protein
MKMTIQAKMIGEWVVNQEQPQFYVPLFFVSFKDAAQPVAATTSPLKENTVEEIAQHWLGKLFRSEVSPDQILEASREGCTAKSHLLLWVCAYIFDELYGWLGTASSDAPIKADLQDRVDIATAFLFELVTSGMLDSLGELATMRCVEYIRSGHRRAIEAPFRHGGS